MALRLPPANWSRLRKKVVWRGTQSGVCCWPLSAPSRAPLLTAPRRDFALSGVAPTASAQAPEPLQLQGARRPRSQVLSSPAAPSVLVGAAQRDAPLKPRVALLGARRARACGVWAKPEEGGTQQARGSAGGRRKPQRHQSPQRRGWGGGNGTPSPCDTPTSGLPRFPSFCPSPASRLGSYARPSPLLWPRLHAPLPCQASGSDLLLIVSNDPYVSGWTPESLPNER